MVDSFRFQTLTSQPSETTFHDIVRPTETTLPALYRIVFMYFLGHRLSPYFLSHTVKCATTNRTAREIERDYETVNEVAHPLCKGRHRDLQPWNKQNVECCLSCGSFYTFASGLHRPLRFGDEIRLVKLHPGFGDEDLIGELIHVRLEHALDFEAVSYTWANASGDVSRSRNLFIKSGNGILKITQNCEAALRTFRHESTPKLLWIDSICVDQQNLLERSEQIQLMASIYKQAQRVLVFIGAPHFRKQSRYEELFNFFKTRLCPYYCTSCGLSDGGSITAVQRLLNVANSPTETSEISRHISLRALLLEFLDHSWFRRIWIIQEVLMAQTVHVHFGSFVVDWADIALDAADSLEDAEVSTALIPIEPKFQSLIPPVLRLRKRIKSKGARLVELLAATRTCEATDARDKVFALLGLARIEDAIPLPRADYTRSIKDVFTEATWYCIQTSQSLSFLLEILSPCSAFPSWVPDYSDMAILPRLPSLLEKPGLTENDCVKLDAILVDQGRRLLADNSKMQEGPPTRLNAKGFFMDRVNYVQKDQSHVKKVLSSHLPRSIQKFEDSMQNLFKTESKPRIPNQLLHSPIRYGNSWLYYNEAIDRAYIPYCTYALSRLSSLNTAYGQERALFCGNEYIGIVPAHTEPDDEIWILATMTQPVVLRKKGRDYQVIGAAYFPTPDECKECPLSEYHQVSVRSDGNWVFGCMKRDRDAKYLWCEPVSLV